MRFIAIIVAATFLVNSPVEAKPRKVIDPISTEILDNAQIASVEVIAEGNAAKALEHFDKKAAEKASTVTDATDTGKTKYSAMPFKDMFPLIMTDVSREWGLNKGRPIKLTVTLDTIKTANAGMAILGGSSDQLAGLVDVTDNESGAKLGSFYIDVLNSHGGMFGMMMRGGGVREKLASEFALESSRVLTGRKSKTRKS